MKILLFIICMMCMLSCRAQGFTEIKLNQPNKSRGHAVMKALEMRKSTKEFTGQKMDMQDLSDILWAANGINRPADGKRTAPSALNKQDVDIYVCLPEGAYLYHPGEHKLIPVVKQDLRKMVATSQEYVVNAPACLVLVSDLSKFDGDEQTKLILGALDAGIVSQNISVFCAGADLATVPRRYMDMENLHTTLKLKKEQYLMMNHPVGYFK